jgi:D-cysteine desulfhydrase
MGLDCHLILRNSERRSEEDPGLVGNLLVERLQGAYIHQVHSSPFNTEKVSRFFRDVAVLI